MLNFNPDNKLPNQENSPKLSNEELIKKVRENYKSLTEFYSAIFEQKSDGNSLGYPRENITPNEISALRFFSSLLLAIEKNVEIYYTNHSNEKIEIPHEYYLKLEKWKAQILGMAADMYYGNFHILDDNGNLIEDPITKKNISKFDFTQI